MTTLELLLAEQRRNPDLIASIDVVCTHHGNSREHVLTCCADGVDCDRCSTLITWASLGLTPLELVDRDYVPLCSDCEEDL